MSASMESACSGETNTAARPQMDIASSWVTGQRDYLLRGREVR